MKHLLILLSASVLTAATPALAQNLLLNGGFESVDQFDLPTDWIHDAASEGSNTVFHTGTRSLQLFSASDLQVGSIQGISFIPGAPPTIPASAGVEYELSGYAMHLSSDSLRNTGHRVRIGMAFLDINQVAIESMNFDILDGTDASILSEDVWHFTRLSMIAPLGTEGIAVGLTILTNPGMQFKGSGYFDDVQLRAIPAPSSLSFFGIAALASHRRRR